MTWEKSGGYPAPGADRTTSIAWSVLDEMASQSMMHGAIREALYVRLGALVEQGEQEAANVVLHAFLDCWALGAVVDDARERWWHEADAAALSTLVRAAEVIRLAIGWSAGPAGPWPVPDESWFEAKRCDWVATPRPAVGVIVELSCDEFVANTGHWMGRLTEGTCRALSFIGSPTDPVSFSVAVDKLEARCPSQQAFERSGFASVHVDFLPDFGTDWVPCLPGRCEDVMIARADGVVVPALATGAPMAMVGWVLWEAPHPPVSVHPISVAVLKELDGAVPTLDILKKLKIDRVRGSQIIDSLVSIGAITAVS